ncbi:hypothetical protein JDV02_004252 [Purpureocillium takamizusanense]|uniref:Bacteriophage T5 Orf172 DNA-binding domain-containing protein n=1 Tax=Purpureocillium takamizusanense TaxID=2060973 RepID=A0A9Q8QDE8_9HYPO|nr:uncharacterized protein JDV02_004252 [Purpureocillium takamizusanense]UNI17948.1 hypothetical protein JDV02_004252 [Purpureocillium takamizusanense]
MPFVANTPESLLGRSDSKNPNSTCRGITSSGKPCRRGIARTATTIAGSTLRPSRRPDPSADESSYCWQHKEQAGVVSAHSSPGPRGHTRPILEERSSLDTLADRLGLVTLHADGKHQDGGRPNGKPSSPPPLRLTRPKAKQKLQCCLCFTVPLDPVHESPPPPPRPRPQPRPVQQTSSAAVLPSGRPGKSRPYDAAASPGKSSQRSRRSNASQTARLKDLIPDTVDAATASALLAELARPFADAEEPGYIYMFWLTPASRQAAPPVDAARSLLSPPAPSSSASSRRRPSDVVSRFADPSAVTGEATMLLKIGRAANVQRRMNQWQRQCGHDIEMLRYYPYVAGASSDPSAASSSSTSATGVAAPRTTPHCRRVERLVHIELAGMGLRASLGSCEACGRDHREWFEVAATREGIRSVDGVIRRWVDWDERET